MIEGEERKARKKVRKILQGIDIEITTVHPTMKENGRLLGRSEGLETGEVAQTMAEGLFITNGRGNAKRKRNAHTPRVPTIYIRLIKENPVMEASRGVERFRASYLYIRYFLLDQSVVYTNSVAWERNYYQPLPA